MSVEQHTISRLSPRRRALWAGLGAFAVVVAGFALSARTGGEAPAKPRQAAADALPPDGWYLTVSMPAEAPAEALEQARRRAEAAGYRARVVPFPGTVTGCEPTDAAVPSGCGMAGAGPGGSIVLLHGPYDEPAGRDELFRWHPVETARAQAEAGARRFNDRIEIIYLKFSQLSE